MKNLKPYENIGLHGCYCHPFPSHAHAILAAKQKFTIGETVKHRCSGKEGIVQDIYISPAGFHNVQFGLKPSDIKLTHSQNLLKLKK